MSLHLTRIAPDLHIRSSRPALSVRSTLFFGLLTAVLLAALVRGDLPADASDLWHGNAALSAPSAGQ